MILWKSKEILETRGEHFPCCAFRWILEIGFWYLGFVHQHQNKSTSEWGSSHSSLYEISFRRPFRLGSDHFYYDGPHCSFSLGWLHFNWGGQSCNKCMPEDD